MAVRWDLLQPVDVGARFQAGWDAATARRQAAEERAYLLDERQREREGRDARAAYMLAGMPDSTRPPSALAPVGPPAAPQPNALLAPASPSEAALSDVFGSRAGSNAWIPPTMGAQPRPGGPNALMAPAPVPAPGTAPAAAFAASPQAPQAPQPSPRDEAFARFVKHDPEAAATMRREEVQENFQRLRNFETLNNIGLQLLAGVNDQASYDRARAQVRELWARSGEDPAAIDQLPPVWTPELNETLRMQGMSTRQQLQSVIQQTRLEWDIEDDQTDNEALEEYRREQIRIRERGQDIGSADRRRGQDLGSRDRRSDPRRARRDRPPTPTTVIGRIMDKQARGEALTPQETTVLREYQAGRGSSRGRGRGRGNAATIVNPQTGQRMRLEGGRWVPAQ